jgi:hypothetical protein
MIRRLLRSALCLCLSPLLLAQQVSQQAGQTPAAAQAPSPPTSRTTAVPTVLKIPKNTEIHLVALEAVSSATATKGQLVRLAVAQDVVVNGLVLIPRGSLAIGVVTHLHKGVAGKRNGSIRITPISRTIGNGTRHKLWESWYGEDDCAEMGPCWLMWTLSAPFILIGLAINGPDYYDQEPQQGKDESINACSSLSGYIAKKIVIQTVDLRVVNPAADVLSCIDSSSLDKH